ncbi:MAG: SOS response-associated peptidase [Planctomycetes bacterium]|nr:SOS response-associated peptidase [Planctomycetota bacterium]MCP4772539.1 SOS response-associated peptidase [Planctomycetota bacterium]MCP4860849.1 SOS response-associated peptidase [Planctomycetota bacterium]
MRQPVIVQEDYGVEIGDAFEPRFNLAPGQELPTLQLREEGGLVFVKPEWGLVPAWAAKEEQPSAHINARVETASSKPSFRQAWQHKRCLVLAEGYYEWPARSTAGRPQGREPYFLSFPGQKPFAMAAILDRSKTKAKAGCAILTKPAAAEIEWLHPRMPIIMESGAAMAWLKGGDPVGHEASLMTTQVSSYVNNVAHEGPRCIEGMPGLFA